MKQVELTIGHITYTYNSISAAWRALSPPNLPMITVRWRLKNDWPPIMAFLMQPVDPVDRRKFKEHRGG